MVDRFMPSRIILAALIGVAVYAQEPKPAIDNDRVTVWDETRTKELHPANDTVVLWLTGPRARTAEFIPKGSHGGKGTKGSRSLVIELKDHPVAPLANQTGYPPAFPRPHAIKLVENDRVIAWSYRWTPGEPSPVHFHDKDVVVVYLEDTSLTSTTPDGVKTRNEYKPFEIRFNLRNRTHTELLDRGTGSAMMLELK